MNSKEQPRQDQSVTDTEKVAQNQAIQLEELNSATLLNAAIKYHKAGFSIIPIKNGEKRPAPSKWKKYQLEQPQISRLEKWFSDPKRFTAFAIVTGHVSGGLLVIDFDESSFFSPWLEKIGDVAEKVAIASTGKGYHVYLLCTQVGRNTKLAFVPCESDESGRRIAIETRGEGGLVLAPPSKYPRKEGDTDSNRSYQWTQGDSLNLPVLSDLEVELLLQAARDLCEAPLSKADSKKKEHAKQKALRKSVGSNGESVIDAFNHAHPITTTLEKYGYIQDGQRYIRPGGIDTSVVVQDGKSYHHNTNDLMNNGHWRSSFDLFCQFEHEGNVKKAVHAAARELDLKDTANDTSPSEECSSQEEDFCQKHRIHQIPKGFACGVFWDNPKGLATTQESVIESDKGTRTIHKPIAFVAVWVAAHAIDNEGELSGKLLFWYDQVERLKWAIVQEHEIIPGKDSPLQTLRNRGLKLMPSKLSLLCDYLSAFNPKEKILVIEQIRSANIKGKWQTALPYVFFNQKEGSCKITYLYRKGTHDFSNFWFKEDSTPKIGFWSPQQENHLERSLHFVHFEDAFENGPKSRERAKLLKKFTQLNDTDPIERQQAIAMRCLAICVALFAAVRPFTGMDGVGVHFSGPSGSGKSSLLQLAASCVGKGGRPGTSGSYLRTWKGTANGIAAEAAYLHGLPLIIDELGVGINKGIGNLIYQLISGTDKTRARRDGSVATQRDIQTALISCGEVSIQHALKNVGVEIKEGQAVRCLDINVERTLWDGEEEVHNVQSFASEHWGFELPRLLQAIYKDIDGEVELLHQLRSEALKTIQSAVSTEHSSLRRIQGHLASLAAVGEYASARGILPWDKDFATKMMILS